MRRTKERGDREGTRGGRQIGRIDPLNFPLNSPARARALAHAGRMYILSLSSMARREGGPEAAAGLGVGSPKGDGSPKGLSSISAGMRRIAAAERAVCAADDEEDGTRTRDATRASQPRENSRRKDHESERAESNSECGFEQT